MAYNEVSLVSAVSSGMVPDKALLESPLHVHHLGLLAHPTHDSCHTPHHRSVCCRHMVWQRPYGVLPVDRCLGHGVSNMPCGNVCGSVWHCVALDGVGWCWTAVDGVGRRWMVLDSIVRHWTALDCPQPMQPQTQQQSGFIPPKKVAYKAFSLVSAVSSGMVPDKELL